MRAATPLEDRAAAGESWTGVCPVCGGDVIFSGGLLNLRESVICGGCGSFNRQRQLVHVLLATLAREWGRSFPTLPSLIDLPGLRLHNTESMGAVHRQLSQLGGYSCSEYFGSEYRSGELVGGVMHQDLMRCSFADASCDVMLSSDVFEHIPEPYVAHREVFRVLRPGGMHVFTVPFLTGSPVDLRRARLTADGTVEHLLEPEYHGDPVRPEAGALVFVIPGLQMFIELAQIGFSVRAYAPYAPESGIVGPSAIVFEAVKPVAG